MGNVEHVYNPAESMALMLILHGSPRPEANEPARMLVDILRRTNKFHSVVIAFLECNSPSIPAALDRCAREGVTQLVAVPYFLHGGRHLVLDIPALLQEGAARHPCMQIQISDSIGSSPLMAEALAARAEEALLK